MSNIEITNSTTGPGWFRRLREAGSAPAWHEVLAPLLALVVAMALTLLGALTVSSRSANHIAHERQRLLVTHYLDLQREKLRFELTAPPQRNSGLVFVVAADGKILQAMRDGAPLSMEVVSVFADPVAIFAAGRAPGLSGPAAMLGAARRDGPGADYARTPDGAYLLGVTALDKQARSVVLARALDKKFIAEMAAELGLSGTRVYPHDEAQTGKGSEVRAFILSRSGRKIGQISWEIQHGEILWRFAPFILMSLILSLAFVLLFSRRVGRAIADLVSGLELASNQASRDSLTGLANRALFLDRLKQSLDQPGGSIAVHYVDLDRFKDINDTMGHPAGDELIRETGHRLVAACRAEDTIARMGGDEFAIIQTSAGSSAAASRLARRLLADLSRPVRLRRGRVHVTASIGVTQIKTGGIDSEEVMRQADIALYCAKDDGRGCFRFFEPKMDEALLRRKSIETDLREAMENDELELAYQPQMAADGEICGVEALLRWRHRKEGYIPPDEFIPVAEESGIITALGEYVADKVFKAARNWPSITVAINVSATELRQSDYASIMTAKAERHGIDPHRVELEITETALLEKADIVASVIRQLKESGFKITLDDFGTQYSSLSYLRQHPVDRLKIDHSFVSAIGVRHDAWAVVNAIVQISKALGLFVTAEGVETKEQQQALLSAGCGVFQGFLFARPLKAQAIDTILANRRQSE